MGRSRALNRFNRFTANRRRRSLRAAVADFCDESSRGLGRVLTARDIRHNYWYRDSLLDFFEPNSIH